MKKIKNILFVFGLGLTVSFVKADGLNNDMLTKAVVKLIKQQSFMQNKADSALEKSRYASSRIVEVNEKTESLREKIIIINDNIKDLQLKIDTLSENNNSNDISSLKKQLSILKKAQQTFIDSLNILSHKINDKNITINVDAIDGGLSNENKKALQDIIDNSKEDNITSLIN